MKSHLLYPDCEMTQEKSMEEYMLDVEKDLDLEILYEIMADHDENIKNAVRDVILHPLTDKSCIVERQNIIKDCIDNEEEITDLYHFLEEVMKKKQEMKWLYSTSPSGTLANSVEKLKNYYIFLVKLKDYSAKYLEKFHSRGFQKLFNMIGEMIDQVFLDGASKLLSELEFKNGMLIKMKLGEDNRCIGYELAVDENMKQHFKWKITPSYTLGASDMAGVRDFCDRKDKASESCAVIVENAALGIADFFEGLYFEVGFYIGVLNLRRELEKSRTDYCFPDIEEERIRKFDSLREINLCFGEEECIGNKLDIAEKSVLVITGANRGGKTVFLKSIGQAQIMMQSGLFVLAKSFQTYIADGIFTHFRREEDEKLKSGKLDEELQRLNRIVPYMKPGSLILYNESLASTNEREGSELCYGITRALMEAGVDQIHVTHLFSFSNRVYVEDWESAYFLRAVRKENGERTYKIEEGRPTQSAFGKDLYMKIWESGDNE